MSETKLYYDSFEDNLSAVTSQDVEPILDRAKMLRDQSQVGADFHHKWSLPNVLVTKFYHEYTNGRTAVPMDGEFWAFVDKKMLDPDYAKFRTDNPGSPFFMGYGK